MAILHLSGISISYPTPEDGVAAEPIISHAESDQFTVSMTLETAQDPGALHAIIRRHMDGASSKITLNNEQIQFIDQQTRQREVVGIMQWRYAQTLLEWVEAAEITPFAEIDSQHDQRKSA